MFNVRLSVGSKNVPGTVTGKGEDPYMGEQTIDLRGLPTSIDGNFDDVGLVDDNGEMEYDLGRAVDLSKGLIELAPDGLEDAGDVIALEPEETEQQELTSETDHERKSNAQHKEAKHHREIGKPKKHGGDEKDAPEENGEGGRESDNHDDDRSRKIRNKSSDAGRRDGDKVPVINGSMEPIAGGGALVHNGREIENEEELKSFKSQGGRRNRRGRGKKQQPSRNNGGYSQHHANYQRTRKKSEKGASKAGHHPKKKLGGQGRGAAQNKGDSGANSNTAREGREVEHTESREVVANEEEKALHTARADQHTAGRAIKVSSSKNKSKKGKKNLSKRGNPTMTNSTERKSSPRIPSEKKGISKNASLASNMTGTRSDLDDKVFHLSKRELMELLVKYDEFKTGILTKQRGSMVDSFMSAFLPRK
eukprot:CAMPEP_0184491364 /NCGR_PEP_ID=MMETSP0113_2-20130426/20237_1 /TAXON_ID=91329 /ORGANISM="Norrisiella sphaerica, Strain BC52" /LENGTH=420 /DNA_ID=CAMNT_0026875703 /DNA_START=232 /DNA_END=1494 /DNA_ORIENTATION=+